MCYNKAILIVITENFMATRVTFSHRPDHQIPLDEEKTRTPLSASTLPMEPIHRPESNHMLKRSYYDSETDQTFSVAVSTRGEKRYLALAEADWQAMLPSLRKLQVQQSEAPPFSVIDLSTGFYTASGEEEGRFSLISHQICANNPDHTERYDALVSMREYLVKKEYVRNLSTSNDPEYKAKEQSRASFAAKKTLEPADETEAATKRAADTDAAIQKIQHHPRTDSYDATRAEQRAIALDAFLDEKRGELLLEHQRLRDELNGSFGGRAVESLTPIELQHRSAMRHEMQSIDEKLAALSHRAELKTAIALASEILEEEDKLFLSALQAACHVREALCIDLEHTEAPQSLEEEAKIQKATDIASLLIPPSAGDKRHNLMSLFYGGTTSLSHLATNEPGDMRSMAPVTLPQSTGHLYLREILSEYRNADEPGPAQEL